MLSRLSHKTPEIKFTADSPNGLRQNKAHGDDLLRCRLLKRVQKHTLTYTLIVA